MAIVATTPAQQVKCFSYLATWARTPLRMSGTIVFPLKHFLGLLLGLLVLLVLRRRHAVGLRDMSAALGVPDADSFFGAFVVAATIYHLSF